jgi:hypothetical protein
MRIGPCRWGMEQHQFAIVPWSFHFRFLGRYAAGACHYLIDYARQYSLQFKTGPISGSHQGQRPSGRIQRPNT